MKKNKGKQSNLNKKLVISGIALATLTIGLIGLSHSLKAKENNMTTTQETTVDKITEQDYKFIDQRLTDLRSGYVNYKISDKDTFNVLYNKKGEAILDSVNGIALYLNNNTFISAGGGEFTQTTDISPLDNIELIVKSKELTKTTKTTKDLNGTPLTVYTFTIDGLDNLEKLYKKVNDTLNKDLLEEYKEKGIDTSIELILYLNDTGIGGEYRIKLDGEVFTVWLFDGYLTVKDWELPTNVYTEDITDINSFDKIFKSAVNILNTSVGAYHIKAGFEALDNKDEILQKTLDNVNGLTDEIIDKYNKTLVELGVTPKEVTLEQITKLINNDKQDTIFNILTDVYTNNNFIEY